MRVGHPPAHHPAHDLLQQVLVLHAFGQGSPEIGDDLGAHHLEDGVVLDEAAGVDVERLEAPGMQVDSRDDGDEALFAGEEGAFRPLPRTGEGRGEGG